MSNMLKSTASVAFKALNIASRRAARAPVAVLGIRRGLDGCSAGDQMHSGAESLPLRRPLVLLLTTSLIMSGLCLAVPSAAGAATTPVNTVLPAISGSPAVETPLVATQGSWSNGPTSYAYAWLRCDVAGANCKAIGGAMSSSYSLTLADVSATIRVEVSAKNAGGTARATSTQTVVVPVPPAPSNTTLPVISGTPVIGSSLAASQGSWMYASKSLTYAWQKCDASGGSCSAISGAKGMTIKIGVADAGGTLRVAVAAINMTGSAVATSLQTTVVPPPLAPINLVLPKISGTAKVGSKLTSTRGTWMDSPTSYVYSWLRCDASGANCSAIAGAIASTYGVVIGDAASTMRVAVSATNLGGSASATSTQTAVVPTPPAPSNRVLPRISGVAMVGYKLAVSNGAWTNSPTSFAYQWQRCDVNGSNCLGIIGATATTYVLGSSDLGSTMRASVFAINLGGTKPATSLQSVPVTAPVAPSNRSLPRITGIAKVADMLTASSGGWTNNPTSYNYQWQRCDATGANCVAMPGAFSATYVLEAVDGGSTIRVVVVASNPAGSATASSLQTATVSGVPSNVALPIIGGALAVGSALSATTGTWLDLPTSYAYQWQRCDSSGVNCIAISSATSTTYGLPAGDGGVTLRVAVTASNSSGSTTVSSDATSVVVDVPGSLQAPTIAGSPVIGATLTLSNGTWTYSPTSYAYAWQRCDATGANCAAIAGVLTASYTLTAPDVGSTVRGSVSASNAAGTATAMSASTGTVTAPPANIILPAVTGTPAVAATLTASTGTWTNSPTGYVYAWQRCDTSGANCADIAGAAFATYVITAVDAGSTLQVLLTASNAAGLGMATSAASPVVIGIPQITAAPVLSGTPMVGSTFSVSTGSWTYSPTSYTYTWLLCDSAGASCVTIPTATTSSYTVVAGDNGSTLQVVITATNAAGFATASSVPTAPIASIPVDTTAPAITGNLISGSTLTASTGTWTNSPTGYAYAWQRCDATGANCVVIASAIGATYTLTDADVSSTLDVIVSAVNSAGSTSSTSGQTTAIWPHAPADLTSPTISGSIALNSVLAAGQGTWTESPVGYTYEWQQCDSSGAICTAITGATAGTYTPIPANVGSTLVVMVTASNIGGSTSATSTPSIVVPASLDAVFTATPTTGVAPLAVSFDASASIAATADSIASYAWNFGDGSSGTGVTTSHTYPVGTYQATLTITSTAKLTATATTSITTTLPAPSGAFTLEAASGTAPLLQVFTAKEAPGTVAGGATDPYTYSWNFGDGSASTTGKTIGHQYGIGTFTATLTMTDPAGDSATTSQTFIVAPSSPVALATAKPATGSAPLAVAFDASKSMDRNPGGSITSYSWDFGDGSTGSGETVSHTYTQNATFTAVLTVTSSEAMSSAQDIAIDASQATALFTTSDISGFSPLAVSFDASGSKAATGENIASYKWNFGDGATGTGVTPAHTYRPGSFNATLTVTTSMGKTATQSMTITVAAQTPIPSFQTSAVSGTSPLVVSFDGTNSIDPNLTGDMSYAWNFGDGSTGTGMTPTHTYGPGTFTATLTVTSDGLSDSESTTVTVAAAAPHASFTTTGTDGVAPFPVTFNATASFDPNPGGHVLTYAWNFGDGNTDTGVTPMHSYLSGTYTATLTVTNSAGLTATESITIFVDPHALLASFTTNPNPTIDRSTYAIPTIGVGPLTVTFNAAGSSDPNPDGGIASFNWDFGDGSTGTGETVTHTYGSGVFFPVLTIVSAAGVSSQLTAAMGQIPTPENDLGYAVLQALEFGTPFEISGEVGVAALYIAASPTKALATFTIGSTTGLSPASNGIQCDPVLTTLCWYPQVNFDARESTPAGTGSEIVSYEWNYGDGTIQSGGSTEEYFYAAPGTYTVTLTVTDSNGNADTTSRQVTVELAPTPSFTESTNSGPGPLTVSFDGSSSTSPYANDPVVTYTWDFGDGTTGSGETVSHAYTHSGLYSPSLTVTTSAGNSNETDPNVGQAKQSITVDAPPNAVISHTLVLGMASVVSFDGSSSGDPNPDSPITTYSWNFGDGTTGSGETLDHMYATPGTYTAILEVTDSVGLTGQAATQVVVTEGPTATLATSTPDLTMSNPVGEFDASGSEAGIAGPIASYGWNFGDGTTTSSTIAQAAHIYKAPGIYPVSVTVTDGSSNTARAYTNVNIDPAIVTIAGSGNTGCRGTVTSICTDAMMGNNGPKTQANFDQITGVVVGNGNTYVVDNSTNTVREITSNGMITRVAGCTNECTQYPGYTVTTSIQIPPGTLAVDTYVSILGIAVDTTGNLYILGGIFGSSNDAVFKVNPQGYISVVAGADPLNSWDTYGGDGGPATQALFSGPQGIAVDAQSNIYISDTDNNRVREVNAKTGIITTIAGDGLGGYGGDGGPATDAALSYPTALTVDAQGNVYVADNQNARVRKVNAATGIITTVAGNMPGHPFADLYGNGDPATSGAEQFNDNFMSLAVDAQGNLYFDDMSSTYRVDTNGTQSSVQVPYISSTTETGIGGIAVDDSGNIVFGNTGLDVVQRLQYPTCGTGVGQAGCSLNNLNLANTPMVGIDLSGADLTNTSFAGDDLAGATLTSATLTGDDFAGANLDGANLSNVDLSGLDFAGANLTGVNLHGATLVNTDFAGANLTGLNLTGLNLSGDNLSGATLTSATLTGVNLSDAHLTSATLTGIDSWSSANLSGADCNSANFTGDVLSGIAIMSQDLPGANFTDATLSGVNLTGDNLAYATLTGASLTGAILHGVNLTGVNLAGISLVGDDLTGATLTGQDLSTFDLSNANFTGAALVGTVLTGATFGNTNFTAANLTGDDLSSRDLRGYDLTGTTLAHVNFSGATLTGVNLSGDDLSYAVLTGATLTGATMTGVDLLYANLSDQDLSGRDLEGTNLSGANLDGTNLSGANLTDGQLQGGETVGTDLAGLTITGATVPGINLSGMTFSNADFTNTDLSGANLSNDTLSDVTLDGANLSNVNFANSNLNGSTLYGTPSSPTSVTGPDQILCTNESLTAAFWAQVIFFGSNPGTQSTSNCQTGTTADLIGANLTGVTWQNANLQYVNLANATLTNAHLEGDNFGRSHFGGATMEGAFLHGAWAEAAHFDNVDMVGDDLSNAILDQASFYQTNLTNASLNSAQLYLAYMQYANFTNTDLTRTDFSFADLTNATVEYSYNDVFNQSYFSYSWANYFYTTCWNGASDNANGEGNDSTYTEPIPFVPVAGIPIGFGCPSGLTNQQSWDIQTTTTILFDIASLGIDAIETAALEWSTAALVKFLIAQIAEAATDGFDAYAIGIGYPGSS